MAKEIIRIDAALYRYLREVSVREPTLFAELREQTARVANPDMQISPDQGQFMALLVKLIGARRAIEVGTFTGYSALWLAEGMGPDGRLVACDISEEWTAIARRYWQAAGFAERIELRLAPAADTLRELAAGDWAGTVDFVFIDADKPGYATYYELALALLRPGGLIAVDNVLWNGAVIDLADDHETTAAVRRFNERLRGDDRVDISLLAIGDGLALARKRERRSV